MRYQKDQQISLILEFYMIMSKVKKILELLETSKET